MLDCQEFLSSLLGNITDPMDLPESQAFYRRIDTDSCQALGLFNDPDTMDWWSRQSEEARWEAFDAAPRHPIAHVMGEFANWCGRTPYPWSHGASFDVVLCEAAFERLGIRTPWKFWNVRDTRTLYAFTGENPSATATITTLCLTPQPRPPPSNGPIPKNDRRRRWKQPQQPTPP